MHRAWLEPCQAELVQPSADRAFMNFDREAAFHHFPQVHTSPADGFVDRRVGSLDDEFIQFGPLLLCQKGWTTRRRMRLQPLDTSLVVAVNPVAQGLPVHAVR